MGLRNLITFFLFALWANTQAAVAVDGGNEPPSLNKEQFDKLEGTYFIKFFSPYCPHCTALAPKWTAAYQSVVDKGVDTFKWASVNCVEQGDLCSEQSITGYPDLRVYRDGKRIYDYKARSISDADLESFALAYASKHDDAFDVKYETKDSSDDSKDSTKDKSGKEDKPNKEESLSDQEARDKKNLEEEAKKLAQAAQIKDEANDEQERSSKDAEKEADLLQKSENKDQGGNKDQASSESNDKTSEKESSKEASNNNSDEKKEDKASSSQRVSALTSKDFGPKNKVGRWFVLFLSSGCQDCESLTQKWENHDNFANDIQGINWGKVDCDSEKSLCDTENVHTFPSLRIYQDGVLAYNYKESTDSIVLRKFLLQASKVTSFEGFSLSDLDEESNSGAHILPSGGQDEPNYMKGPAVQKPEYGSDPKIMDVVKYTLDTLGQPIDEDPGKIIFGSSPENHHNFRTWGAPDAPPPAYIKPGTSASEADGHVKELDQDSFSKLVKSGTEPWIIKFYSPKCPYCVSMASEYDILAQNLKNKLNVGAVDCEKNAGLCDQEQVKVWPLITLYKGGKPEPSFTGGRTSQEMSEYAEQAWGSQIIPIETEEDLSKEIISNIDSNLTTFIYLYDQSVMEEDWESLSKVAVKIGAWGGKLYRSNSDRLRELAGITHRGTAFVNVDLFGEGENALKWYSYPWSNIPKRIRNSEDVAKWAYRTKYTLLQYLDPYAQMEFSPYIAIVLTDGTQAPSKDKIIIDHKEKALELRDFYRERQIKDQDRIRIDRLNKHDAALLENKFALSRSYMKQAINAPLFTDLSFAYIPLEVWSQRFGPYLDVYNHKVGTIVIVDFYHGIYIDQFDHVPIKDDREELDKLVDFLHKYEDRDSKTVFSSLNHFKKPMKGIPEPHHRSTHFQPENNGDTLFSYIWKLIKILIVLGAFYFVFSKVVRPRLRELAARNRADHTVSTKYD